MTKTQSQKIFKLGALEQIKNELRSGNSLESYFKETFPINESELWTSSIVTEGNIPDLQITVDGCDSPDLENAILLYKYYGNLDETQASDPRLWAYLSHIEFRKYTLARWGIKGTFEDLKRTEEKVRAINYVYEHWFAGENDRDLRRHAISRLWWATHLTYAPWESDPEFFKDLKNEDTYYYTRVLFLTQDIYQQLLERSMGRSNRILISVLDYLSKNPKFAQSRESIRTLMKELNLVYGTKKIITLEADTLKDLIYKIASEINITT